jgi:chromosome segregation ATPase
MEPRLSRGGKSWTRWCWVSLLALSVLASLFLGWKGFEGELERRHLTVAAIQADRAAVEEEKVNAMGKREELQRLENELNDKRLSLRNQEEKLREEQKSVAQKEEEIRSTSSVLEEEKSRLERERQELEKEKKALAEGKAGFELERSALAKEIATFEELKGAFEEQKGAFEKEKKAFEKTHKQGSSAELQPQHKTGAQAHVPQEENSAQDQGQDTDQ